MATIDPNKRLRVRVDPIRCTAFGFCAEFCPELFDLDAWGYAWLKDRALGIWSDDFNALLARSNRLLAQREPSK